jgi:hypothetical protein
MGASGRCEFNCKEANQAVDFFVDSFKAYVDKTNVG